jgi:hypothetical protein
MPKTHNENARNKPKVSENVSELKPYNRVSEKHCELKRPQNLLEKFLGIRKKNLTRADIKAQLADPKNKNFLGYRLDMGLILVMCLCCLIIYVEVDNLFQYITKKDKLLTLASVAIIMMCFMWMLKHLLLHHTSVDLFEVAKVSKSSKPSKPTNPALKFAQECIPTIVKCAMGTYSII